MPKPQCTPGRLWIARAHQTRFQVALPSFLIDVSLCENPKYDEFIFKPAGGALSLNMGTACGANSQGAASLKSTSCDLAATGLHGSKSGRGP